MQKRICFPTIGYTFRCSPTTIFGRNIQSSCLDDAARIAYIDFFGNREGMSKFREEIVQKNFFQKNQYVSLLAFSDRESGCEGLGYIYPLSRGFEDFPILNSFSKIFTEVQAATLSGYLSELMVDSSALTEGYSPYSIPESEGLFRDLITILTMENIRKRRNLSQRNLLLLSMEVSSSILANMNQIYLGEYIYDRLNDMPKGFYDKTIPRLH